ncbi:excinuclease ABC subunit A [candidate division CPR3 bacterium 4484_211]|uniref:UvrABC system protein A n=1 Tax=candidate division CPR3 bacterium 4484_211 TaxID=1968527 RepID=A0A1W9NZ86_UNCC3|nr:MAG: excinuclease ABC subunit A [candidate division CPR3 bacterium 4484_211]
MGRNISIRGAREHNLKNINLDIPKQKLIVFTGISGSGKSSLAFDTIYAEGQRRYVESLSPYARQFLGIMDKPDVDRIEGLAPSISIGQKEISHNPRSTVGTITETYDFLRLLFARIGHPHCPQCSQEIQTQTPQQIVDQITSLIKRELGKTVNKKRGVRIIILSPLVKDRKGEYSALLGELLRKGFTHARIDRQVRRLDEDLVLIRTNRHTIEAVVDRLVIKKSLDQELKRRLTDSVEKALKLSNGTLIVSLVNDSSFDFPQSPQDMKDHLFSELFACPKCNISLPQLEPRTFSFNSPHGACPLCGGLGIQLKIDPTKVYNPNLTINEGGIYPWSSIGDSNSWIGRLLEALSQTYHFSLDMPIKELPEKILEIILFGAGDKTFTVKAYSRSGSVREYRTKFEGVVNNLERRYRETNSDQIRRWIEKFMKQTICPKCQGTRLKPAALSVTIKGKNIAEISALSINEFKNWIDELKEIEAVPRERSPLTERERQIARPIIKELTSRVRFLTDVGLGYLTLNRTGFTLSTGEAQRIRLASQIGSGLSGVLYVLDEPSIGLHYRDHKRLLDTLTNLRDLDNTVIVVEHDPQTIRRADWIADFGPLAGEKGGEIVACGTLDDIINSPRSITGQYLSGKKTVKIIKKTTESLPSAEKPQPVIKLIGCCQHNLNNIDVVFPLGKFVCVTGVSGSGKSTLVMDTLYKRLAREFYQTQEVPGKHRAIQGLEHINRVINIDQSPIGRTPRSNPATYTGAFTPIRELFAQTPEARARGYLKGRFSFNVKGGRCENCQGDGLIKIEMQFLSDVYVECEVCRGLRYNRETLEIKYKNKNIAEVLEMSVDSALDFFKNIPSIKQKLNTLSQVGLGYIKLGQPAPTLSGGEAQRVKLAKELSKTSRGHTVYILDEPTTGLHSYDIERLLRVLHQLVDQGNTIIVIEHNMDIIKTADWIIDLGPEGGNMGGRIVAQGCKEEIMKCKKSYTGKYLKEYLGI